MNVYTVEFQGKWPVGACAIVVAKDRGHVRRLLQPQIERLGLNPDSMKEPERVDLSTANAQIIMIGEY